MTIIRNGIQITLTEEEKRQAYHELKREYLLEDIQSRYDIPDEMKEDIIDRVERSLECNDSYWESYWLTIDYVCMD